MTRLLPLLNVLGLAAAYAALFTHARGASASYRAALAGGALLVIFVAAWTWSARVRHAISAAVTRVPVPVRALAAILPWVGVMAVWATRGLWWTQRPAELRLFVLYALAIWSVAWTFGGERRERDRGGRPAAAIVAAILGALGIQGATHGFSPVAVSISIAMICAAAVLLTLAAFGGPKARLNTVSAVVSILLALLTIEAAVRLLGVGANVRETDQRSVAREFFSMTPPGAAFVVQPQMLDEFPPALIEINRLGIRGPEIATDEPAALLLIGDSFVEARQLNWDQTVSARLAEAFRARGLDGRVVGHGVRGWSPLLEWNWYLKVGRRLRPKVVMLCFFWNDLWASGRERATFGAVFDANGRPAYFDVRQPPPWLWTTHVRTIRLLEDVWGRLGVTNVKRAFSTLATRRASGEPLPVVEAQRVAQSMSDGPPLTEEELRAVLTTPAADLPPALQSLAASSFWPGLRPMSLWTAEQRDAAAAIEDELAKFAEDVARDGATFVVMYVPNPVQVGTSECSVGRLFDRLAPGAALPPDSGVQEWLRGAGARHDFEVIDPTAAMREREPNGGAGEPAPFYLRADCHWSPRGHQFIADWVAEWYRGTSLAAR